MAHIEPYGRTYMKESLPVSLKYSGKNVDDGSMELGDIVSALQGFSNAYAKIVVFKKSDVRHTIKISCVTVMRRR